MDKLVERLKDAIACAGDDREPAIILSAPDCRTILAALTADAGMERAAEMCEAEKLPDGHTAQFDAGYAAACGNLANAIRAASAQVNAEEPKPLMQCSCGEPWTLNVVHRNPDPCFYWQGAPATDTSAPAAGQVVVPVEPTEAMLDELLATPNVCSRSDMRKRYAAMLRAAGSRHE